MSEKLIEITIDPATLAEIDEAASQLETGRDEVIRNAIEAFLELRRWQVEEIKEGLRELDRGDRASAEEVKRVFDKWRGH